MSFLRDFFHQKVPKAGREIPAYYRRALATSETLLVVYFVLCFFAYPVINHGRWEWVPLLFTAFSGFCLWMVSHQGVRVNLILYGILCVGWVGWNVQHFGWSSGVQHFMTLMLVFVFFNIFDGALLKILWFAAILAIRVLLFSFSQQHPAVYSMDAQANTIYQTLNSVTFFLMLALVCIIFSTNIQEAERLLLLRNEELHREAGTDPLTGLPNRRAMMEQIGAYCAANSDQPFCVAIADIDFFKKVNDTYGHSCGDYTLVKLTELFRGEGAGRYSACRWGGEEFCLFMPGMNLDEAGVAMNDLCIAAEHMALNYEGHEFSITITIGVEEYDFASPLENLLETADEKLYMGKNNGRNQVVV